MPIHGVMTSRTAQGIGFIIVLVIILGYPPLGIQYGTHTKTGYGDIGPGSIFRTTIRGSQGDIVVFSYEADLGVVECALIELGDRNVSDFTRDTDLHEIACFYYQVKMREEMVLTMTYEYRLLLFARNYANVTQWFSYEWTSRNPTLNIYTHAIMRVAVVVPVVLCGISVLLCKKRHEQLLRDQRPEEWDHVDA